MKRKTVGDKAMLLAGHIFAAWKHGVIGTSKCRNWLDRLAFRMEQIHEWGAAEGVSAIYCRVG